MSPTIKRRPWPVSPSLVTINMTSTMSRRPPAGQVERVVALEPPGVNPSRWMVAEAGRSGMRLARQSARTAMSVPCCRSANGFDDGGATPGPPSTSTGLVQPDSGTAFEGETMCFSTHGKALFGSIHGHGSAPFASRVSRSAMVRSARCRPARSTHGVSPAQSVTPCPHAIEIERSSDELLRHLEQILGQWYRLLSAGRNGPHPWPRSAHKKSRREPGSSRSSRCRASSQ